MYKINTCSGSVLLPESIAWARSHGEEPISKSPSIAFQLDSWILNIFLPGPVTFHVLSIGIFRLNDSVDLSYVPLAFSGNTGYGKNISIHTTAQYCH